MPAPTLPDYVVSYPAGYPVGSLNGGTPGVPVPPAGFILVVDVNGSYARDINGNYALYKVS